MVRIWIRIPIRVRIRIHHHGSESADPDPDSHQNDTDPQHCLSGFKVISFVPPSPAETPECWSLQFQTEAIIADNFVIFAENFTKFAEDLDI